MCLSLAIILVASEDEQTKELKKLQLDSMISLIGYSDSNTIFSLLRERNFTDRISKSHEVFLWYGVHCEKGFVDQIEWSFEQVFYKPNLAWIPPTTTSITCKECVLCTEIDTRSLPRKLAVCQLNSCALKGEVELRTLPETLVILSLTKNALNGTVRLTDLPQTIREMDFTFNQFENLIVDNTSLPDSLTSVKFNQHNKCTLKIIVLDDKSADKRIRSIKYYDSLF